MYSQKPTRKPGDPPHPPTTQQSPDDTQLQSGGLPAGGPALYFGKESGMPPLPQPMDAIDMGPGVPPPSGPPSLSDTSNVLAANPGGMGMPDMNGAGVMANGAPLGPGSIAPGSAGDLPADGTPWTPQDTMMAAYLAATLGGSVGTLFKRPAPPPPIAPPGVGNTAPSSTPTASQAALGLATSRKSGKGGFGGRG